ncbi:aromatic acid exporter family protein [Streptomyces sp. NPDC060223]|uniref:FUSC family protein n=1 Tax=unclassified Streptomyces TaxID=2593676 RepID=UPI00363DA014
MSPNRQTRQRRRFPIVANALTWETRAVWRSIRRAVTESGAERDTAVQSLKAAGAALLAWALAGWWWDAPMALMAPWTALSLVQNTVYRSLLSAFQQFAMVVVGTLLAAAAGVLTDNTMAAMALALPLTVLLGNYARFGAQGLYAPTAALFALAYGSYTGPEIAHRFLETLLGAVIGIGVNALVFPPVHSRRVRHLRAQLPFLSAELLHDVADGLAEGYTEEQARGWYDRAQRLTDVVTDLREQRRWSDESYRANPGLRMRRRAAPARPKAPWDFVWDQVTENIATTIRTLAEPARRPVLSSDAIDALTALLRAAGDVCRFDEYGQQAEGRPCDDAAPARNFRLSLAEASAAHRRLTALCAGRNRTVAPTTGGLLADARRLLSALLRIADPEAALIPG